ncbi:MAG: NADH-quinone oxidoreductase subunit C [Gaiellales bacterium]
MSDDTRTHTHTHYRDAIRDAVADGARLVSLYATADADAACVRTVICRPNGLLETFSVAVADGAVPSLVDIDPTAEWPEREAHDLHAVRFDGHEPLRPLVDHPAELASWTVPVSGDDVYQIAVGPIHAGVIESGHFRLHVVGDRILHLDLRLFFKHRGLERAAAGHPLDDAIAYAQRACGACAVTNSVAYAHAAEQLRGLRPAADIARARTLLLELERLWSHLNDVAAICSGVGLAAGNQRFAALCEDARRLNQQIAGHRFLFDSVDVGRSRLYLNEHDLERARDTISNLRRESTVAWHELAFNASVQDRLVGVGVLDHDDALTLGAVGPVARSAGIPVDARTDQAGRLAYDGFVPAMIDRPTGDVRARFAQRDVELRQTLDLLDDLLESPIFPGYCVPGSARVEHAVARIESPRGATICALEAGRATLTRMHLRTGSYANWPVLVRVVPGNLMPDFPLINKSFELCYACADR